MALLSNDDVERWAGDAADNRLLDKFFAPAFEAFQKLTCDAYTQQTVGEFTGIVGADGLTVHLPYWSSEITSVTTLDNKTLTYTFTPNVGDVTADDITSIRYAKTLTLDAEHDTGTVLKVSGTYGFDNIPDSIKQPLVVIMLAYQNRSSGDDYVTSKSIEDVNVSISDHSKESPLALPLSVYQAQIDKWSLCPTIYGSGLLAYPRKRMELPYWITDADLQKRDSYGAR